MSGMGQRTLVPVWGGIGGSLTDQADLSTVLGAKADLTEMTTALGAKANITEMTTALATKAKPVGPQEVWPPPVAPSRISRATVVSTAALVKRRPFCALPPQTPRPRGTPVPMPRP